LPPGLAISAELSEFYMQDFDQRMREQLNAHYFARYVDDIVLILPELENPNSLKAQIEEALPKGLKLNFSKSKIYPFKNAKMKTPTVEHSLDYLGFRFSVFNTDKARPVSRRVELDIALSKVRKNKTRIVKSLLRYLGDGNFADLRDRVRILTCGYQFFVRAVPCPSRGYHPSSVGRPDRISTRSAPTRAGRPRRRGVASPCPASPTACAGRARREAP